MRAKTPSGSYSDSVDGRAIPQDVSRRALTIARLIDRHCRAPGEYVIRVNIPYHSRGEWHVEISRSERIRSMKVSKKESGA
ncbi:MAG: hypothetical protein ACK2T3_11715 [Candidatus Promineifilaceae bacterium]